MKITKECIECGHDFLTENKYINRGEGKFCSVRCGALYNAKTKQIPNTICAFCKSLFYRPKSKNTIKRSKSGLFFCSVKHKNLAQRIVNNIIKVEHYKSGIGTYRQRTLESKESRCNRCGFDSTPDALIIHHKDRNRGNNELANLEVLCHNCHYLEHRNELIEARKLSPPKTKIQWPDTEELVNMVRQSSYAKVAKKLGVSDTAVKKRLKTKGLYKGKIS